MATDTTPRISLGKGLGKAHSDSKAIIRFSGFTADLAGDPLKGLDLDIFKGEILGITSLPGHGRSAIGPGMMGLCPVSGQVKINGKETRLFSHRDMMLKNICLIHDDMKKEGLLKRHSVMENIVLAAFHAKKMFSKRPLFFWFDILDRKQSIAFAKSCVHRFDIRCHSIFQKLGELSGGNQQKVAVARAIATRPEVLFVNEPTRGVDIAAQKVILDILTDINKTDNTTVVISSGELNALKRTCDRIVVLYQGKVAAVFEPDTDDAEFAKALAGEPYSSPQHMSS